MVEATKSGPKRRKSDGGVFGRDDGSKLREGGQGLTRRALYNKGNLMEAQPEE